MTTFDQEKQKPVHTIMGFFAFRHLPEKLQKISEPFGKLAWEIHDRDPARLEETVMALRKLLEAKDCAVRAAMDIK